ncbi:DUF4239 domain-containing protein [Solihabitans fulvus]|uniref:DUF4239 domain-containing protein n=1 Tax=Solihabitans fulvus TaxID=1892852 RepID=A0A5B2XFE9_9PSEU|nr:DUF4239 domain-containing protein [Solihabitans fulvus]KAA2261986.1 DUF4239 domain-containing protein [Solihabitans fulvus]
MPVSGSLLVLGIAVATCVLLVLVTRFVPSERRALQNEVVGFVYAVVGVIYAVILAMVVVGLWTTADATRTNTYSETNALLQISWYAHSLPQPAHNEIRDLNQRYAEAVENTEWPLLAKRQSSDQAWREFTALRDTVVSQQPATGADQVRYAQALDAVARLGDARRERLNRASDTMPALLWVALILGGLVTVGFAFMFGMTSLRAHIVVVFSITLLIGSMLLLVYELSQPFSGTLRVEPTAFELALQRINLIS